MRVRVPPQLCCVSVLLIFVVLWMELRASYMPASTLSLSYIPSYCYPPFKSFAVIPYFDWLIVLGVEARPLSMPGKYSTIELHPQPLLLFLL